jgi:parallel beta-helix repeat protein
MRLCRNTRLVVESLEARETPATLYVSPTGADTNSGTVATPLQTLQAAANRVVAGDSVIVGAGTYRGFSLTRDGTAAARITFQADPAVAPGSVIINQPNAFTGRDGINLEGASYVTIQGFTVTGQSRAGIRSVTNEFVVIRDNVADNNGVWGIFTGFSSDVRIENNQASRSQQQHGIYVSNSADRPVVRGNTAFENYLSGIQLNADASVGGDGIISGAVIENNIMRANGAGGGASINLDGVQNSDIRNNVIDNARASGIALFRIDGGGGSSNNRITNNTIVVDHSLNTAAGRWAVTISGGSTGNVVRNNVIFSTHSFRGAISVTSDSRSGLVSDYNAVEDSFSIDGGGTATGLTGWQAATGQDLHSLRLIDLTALNALFLNRLAGDYHLHALSPAIDRGTATGAPNTDFEGTARPSGLGYDIGPDEFRLSTSASASYVGTDATTQGSWRGVYGADGYSMAQGATSLPSYATTTPRGHSNWTWAASTADTRALQKPAPATDRLAAVWYGNTFTVDVSVGSTARRVSLYMTDWDTNNRSQKIEVLNAATGAVLDTRTVSGFRTGVWLSWDLTGDVKFRVTKLSGVNAVLNGVFFGNATTTPSTPSEFTVAVRSTGLTSSQQAIFQQAAQRWSEIIVGDLPNEIYNGVAVDDILIEVAVAPRDGQGGLLGFAGPDRYRLDTWLPYHATMTFDSADIAWLESSGNLLKTVVHEMGHALGVGTLWLMKNLVSGAGTANPIYTGPRATAEYNRIFGTSAIGVPVESSGGSGTADVHWRDSVFGNEVMTGWLDMDITNPISRITVASLADEGYTVDLNAADNYVPPS